MNWLLARSALYFLSSLGAAAISVMVLPFATKVIGSTEYGELAVAVSIAALVTAGASACIGYIMPEYYLKTPLGERGDIAGVALAGAVLGGGITTLLVSIILPFSLSSLLSFGPNQFFGIYCCLIGAFVATPWVVASEVLMLEGRALAFTIGTVGQALANGIVVLTLLYVFPKPDVALFIGNMVGQLVLSLVAVVILSRVARWPSRPRRWFRIMFSKTVASGRASLTESGRALFERLYMGSWVSVSAVGLFSHAQLYRNWAMTGLNAVSRAAWPINLEEANEDNPTFKITFASWRLVQLGLTFCVVVFVLFGREIIGLLSSGKFVEAQPLAVILLASLLVQTGGKPEMVLLIARGEGQHMANAVTLGTIAAILAMAALVPLLGAVGAACAVFVQVLLTRVLVIRASHRLLRLPFSDKWIAVGLISSACLYFWGYFINPGPGTRGFGLAVVGILACVASRRDIAVLLGDRRFGSTSRRGE